MEDMVAHTQAATRLLLVSFSPQGSGTKIKPQFVIINSKRTHNYEDKFGEFVREHLGTKGYSLEDWGGLGQMKTDTVCQFRN